MAPMTESTLLGQRDGPDSESLSSTGTEVPPPGRRYQLRTIGCQMNVHDSERMAGLLESSGYIRAEDGDVPDVIVFNTCAVRENADNRLYGNLGHLRPLKQQHPDLQIAVGGCLAQKDRREIVRRAPWVDVVFGTHNIGSLPVLLDRARVAQQAQVEIVEALEVFPSDLPSRRDSAHAAWVSISVGCNNTCTFCIVPSLRGRRSIDVLATCWPRSRPSSRGRRRSHAAGAERERLRRAVRRSRSLRRVVASVR